MHSRSCLLSQPFNLIVGGGTFPKLCLASTMNRIDVGAYGLTYSNDVTKIFCSASKEATLSKKSFLGILLQVLLPLQFLVEVELPVTPVVSGLINGKVIDHLQIYSTKKIPTPF